MRKSKMMVLRTVFLAVSMMPCAPPPAMASMDGEEIRYVVTTRGFEIGNVMVAQKSVPNQGETETYFENRTDISASFLWMRYRQSLSEHAALKKDNLVQYRRHGKNNNDAFVSVDGWLSQGTFNLMVTENGKQETLLIPRRDYDRTTMECPEAFMDFGAGGKAILRILDMEHLVVVTRNYRLVREDVYRLGEREFPCRVVDFSDIYKSCRRWIGKYEDTVVIFRQDGKCKEGSYSVRAISLHRPLQCNLYEWICDQPAMPETAGSGSAFFHR
jgi:hypothetical protein